MVYDPHRLPLDFVTRVRVTFAPDGEAWLAALPDLVEACARRWNLTVGPPFPALSYNYVAPATLPGGEQVVLKLGVPREEIATEIEALRHYAGEGAVALLDADEPQGALLLERLLPGGSLSRLSAADDETTTRIAAAVMRRLWRPPPAGHSYPTVERWAAGLAKLRPHFAGGTGPFPAHLLERAEALFAELLTTQEPPVLLHGDLHHDNILDAGGGRWLAIDPKGVVGEPAYETGALIRNPAPQIIASHDLAALLARRITILATELHLDERRIHGWALAQAVLSAWWDYEDGSTTGVALRIAEALAATANE